MSTPASGESPHASPEVQKYRPRACQSCARSKMRCAKIKAPCTLPELNPRKKRGPSTRVGQLEEKIDGIMSLLNASQQIQQNSQTPTPESNRSGIQSLLNPMVEAPGPQDLPEPPAPASFSRLAPPPSVTTDASTPHIPHSVAVEYVEIIPGFQMGFDEADRALNLYRSVYTPYFPFVPVPVMTSAYDLYTRSPLLFRVIIQATAPQSAAVQREARVWFRQYLAQHVVVEQERRLEILQAILVHLAWGDFYFYFQSEATHLIHLAVSLVVELGLSKAPTALRRAPYSLIQEAVRSLPSLRAREEHTFDDMRAMLGCFFLVSVVSSLFRRMHSIPYTSYMGHCCDALQNAQEYDSDKFLVALVRMQGLLGRIADISPGPDVDSVEPRVAYAPFHMAMASIRKELDALVENQPPEVECNVLLWTHYHGVVTRLYEPAIYARPTVRPGESETFMRTEALWSCLRSLENFFAAYATIPLDNLGSSPLVATAQLSFAIVTATRLLFLDDSGWDVTTARKSYDFSAMCKHLCERFDEADRMAQTLARRRKYLDDDKTMLSMYRDKLRWIRHWYITKTASPFEGSAAAAGNPAATSAVPGSSGGGQAMDLDQEAAFMQSFELDESFWQGLMDFDGRATWAGLAD